ncbi:MAG TPA: hypothetical protein DD420_33590 [Streptomyces sp.]|nr:nitrite reductase (NAD(P)H) small subunit [Streptomyces sp. MBT51]HBF84686.1 hypothetical protein [Streptomyces sp.]
MAGDLRHGAGGAGSGLTGGGRGVAALLPYGRQVALLTDRAGRVDAIDNRDPFTGAYVLSRGLVGSAAGRPFVASPLLKQRFDLATGVCLDEVRVPVYAVRADRSRAAPADRRPVRLEDRRPAFSPDGSRLRSSGLRPEGRPRRPGGPSRRPPRCGGPGPGRTGRT